MPWRKYCALITAAVFFAASLLITAPPSAWAQLLEDDLVVGPSSGQALASDPFETQAGNFISLVHSSITSGSAYDVTFSASGGRTVTFHCADSFDGFLKIQVPLFPDGDGVDSETTEATVSIGGISGSPSLLVEPPPTFEGEYDGQAIVQLIQVTISAYQEQAASLRARAATGLASGDLEAAAARVDQHVTYLQDKVDYIITDGILPVQQQDGGAYSFTPYGMGLVDDMIAAYLGGIADECEVRVAYASSGQLPAYSTSAKRKTMNAADVNRSVNIIKNAWSRAYLEPWAKLGIAVFGGLITAATAWVSLPLGAFVGAGYALYLVWAAGLWDMSCALSQNVNKEDGYIDQGLNLVKNGLNAASNMLGAVPSCLQWLVNAWNNGNTVVGGVQAYQDAVNGGGGGSGGGGGGGGSSGDLTAANILGTWSFDGWYKDSRSGCVAASGRVTFNSNGTSDWGQQVGDKWLTSPGAPYKFNDGYLSVGDMGAGKVSGDSKRFTVQFPNFCHDNTWTFYR